MRIVVVGAGYAGIACLARLPATAPGSERHLVAPQPWHLHRTRLHESLREPLSSLREPLPGLARRWRFSNHRATVKVTPQALRRWDREGVIELGRRRLGFDFLVLATGLPGPRRMPRSPRVVGLEDVASGPGRDRLARLAREDGPPLWVVGAGASGLQFAFELAAAGAGRLVLVDAADALLPGEPRGLVRYVRDRLDDAGIELRPGRFFEGFSGGAVRLASRPGGAGESHEGRGVLMCTGPAAPRLPAAADGRLLIDGSPAERIYAAGDCATWAGEGFDAATAQAAIRKGRSVADNLGLRLAGNPPEDYDARRLGFFLSLGPGDGVGWALSRAALVKGLAAAAAREAIEARWSLLLDGLDTFGAF